MTTTVVVLLVAAAWLALAWVLTREPAPTAPPCGCELEPPGAYFVTFTEPVAAADLTEPVELVGGPADGELAAVVPGVATLRVPVWVPALAGLPADEPGWHDYRRTDRGTAGRRVYEYAGKAEGW